MTEHICPQSEFSIHFHYNERKNEYSLWCHSDDGECDAEEIVYFCPFCGTKLDGNN